MFINNGDSSEFDVVQIYFTAKNKIAKWKYYNQVKLVR